MSSLVSGITKLFTSLGTHAATLGSAIRGVGASLFTAGAATGTSAAGGTLSSLLGTGTLSNIFAGIGNVMGLGPAGAVAGLAAAPAALAATGLAGAAGVGPAAAAAAATDFAGPWGAALTAGANTATGFEPTGLMTRLGDFLGTQGGANLVAGLGAGAGEYLKSKNEADIAQADRDFLRDKERRITDSYNVPNSALAGGVQTSAAAPPRVQPKTKWQYNKNSGQIESVAA